VVIDLFKRVLWSLRVLVRCLELLSILVEQRVHKTELCINRMKMKLEYYNLENSKSALMFTSKTQHGVFLARYPTALNHSTNIIILTINEIAVRCTLARNIRHLATLSLNYRVAHCSLGTNYPYITPQFPIFRSGKMVYLYFLYILRTDLPF
jgi:hypothetical protein